MTLPVLPVWDDLPDFGLYMDQMMTCAVRIWGDTAENLTSGMINSYVKSGLMERPQGKKYSRTALAQLLMICCLKPTMSLEELRLLLHPVGEDMEHLYTRFRTGLGVWAGRVEEGSAATPLDAALAAAVYSQQCLHLLHKSPVPLVQTEDGNQA